MEGALLAVSGIPANGLRSCDSRRRIAVFAVKGSSGDGGPDRVPATGRREKMEVQKSRNLSVTEVRRLIGVSDEENDGAWAEDDNRRSPVLDFWASTPIGQEESAPEKKLREIGEWLVERTESKGVVGQQVLLTVFLYVLPLWVVLVLLASGAVRLPFEVPFLDDLLS